MCNYAPVPLNFNVTPINELPVSTRQSDDSRPRLRLRTQQKNQADLRREKSVCADAKAIQELISERRGY